MYYKGIGVPQNFIYAYSWLHVAATRGEKRAIKLRDTLLVNMSSNQIAQAKKISLQIVQEMIQRLEAQKKLPVEKSQGVYKTPK